MAANVEFPPWKVGCFIGKTRSTVVTSRHGSIYYRLITVKVYKVVNIMIWTPSGIKLRNSRQK